MNVFVGPNAQGKSSLLEAVCVLLRLQSPRIAKLGHAIRHEQRGFVLDGYFAQRHMQFYFSRERKKLALDSVEQKSARQYLEVASVVHFSNADIEIVRGAAEQRRRFMDFVAAQMDGSYRKRLRDYERALRSRNFLLKAARQNWREISAFDRPLVEAGDYVTAVRRRLATELEPHAAAAQSGITSQNETLTLRYTSGSAENFADELEKTRDEDSRLRQTNCGPHRDELFFTLNGVGAEIASEGQQRSIVLSLKLAQTRLLALKTGAQPLLLLDDIFGELDPARRNALFASLPPDAQQLVTTTHLDWMRPLPQVRIYDINAGKVRLRDA